MSVLDGVSVKNGNDKLHYKGDFLQWQDAMHPVFCSLLAKFLVLSNPPFPQPDEPANVANPANTWRQKLVDDWDKANELATATILANLPPRNKHLVRDNMLSACELWDILKAKLCVVSSSSKDTARYKSLSCIQTASQTVDVHLNNYLRAVDYMSSMQIEESVSLLSLVFFILSTRLALARNVSSLIHGGDARKKLTILLLTSGMPSKNSGRRNPKATQ